MYDLINFISHYLQVRQVRARKFGFGGLLTRLKNRLAGGKPPASNLLFSNNVTGD